MGSGAVIAIANPKGGTGKTTTTLALAERLGLRGVSVCVIDMDPHQPLFQWVEDRRRRGRTTPFAARPMPPGHKPDKDLLDMIAHEAPVHDYVLIDLEGTRSMVTARAISRAHLVIIPVTASKIETNGAEEALELIQVEEESLRRPIPYALSLNRAEASGVVSRAQKRVEHEIHEGEVRRFNQMIRRGGPFEDLISSGLTLQEQMDETAHLRRNGRKQVACAIEDIEGTAEEMDAMLEVLTTSS